jgi:WD40 repeat protein
LIWPLSPRPITSRRSPLAHDAFISYSHSADGRLAPAIERGLQRLARPWNRLRAVSVFRDESDLILTPELGSTITAALDDSRYLILLACPESAASIWVNREVDHWCDTNGTDHLLLIVTGGDLAWDPATGEFDEASTAVPESLRGRYTEEPLYLDLRWARDTPELSLRLSRFRAAIAQIAAPIRGLAPEELEGEDIRLHRRARRLARAAVATVAVLAVVATIAAVLAVGNARRADRRAREALGRQLGLVALDLPAGELDQAFLLSLAAADLQDHDDHTRFQATRALIGRNSRLDALLHPVDGGSGRRASFRGVAIAPDGGILATAWSPDGSAELLAWNGELRTPSGAVAIPPGFSPSIAVVGDAGRIVIGGPPGRVATVLGSSVTPVGERVVALDLPAARALVMADTGVLDLVDVDRAVSITGPIGEVPSDPGGETGAEPLHDLANGRAVVAAAGRIALLESTEGAELASAQDATPLVTIAVGPDDATAVLGASIEGTISTWRRDALTLVAGEPVASPAQVGRPRRLVASPDGRRVLVMGDAGSALVNLATGDPESIELGATGLVAIDPSGRFAAIGGARLAVWDLTTGQRAFAVPEPANALAWSGRCDEAVACKLVSAGESLDVWDPAGGRRVQLADQTNAQAVAISRDASTVVTAGWGDTVAVWKLAAPVDDSGRSELAPAGSLTAVDPVSGAVARYDGVSRVEIVVAGSARDVVTGAIDGISVVAGASHLLVEAVDGLALVAIDDGEPVDLDDRCAGDRYAVSPSGRYVVTHRTDTGATVVCDLASGQMLVGATVDGVAEPVGAVAVDDNGHVAIGGGDGFVEFYRVDGGRFATGVAVDVRFGGEAVDVTSLAIRDGVVAAGIRPTGGRSAVARALVWDADGGGTPVQFDTDHRDIAAVGLLGEAADLVVVAGGDGTRANATLQVWEVETRRRLGRALGGLAADVVMLGGDGSAVVGVDADGRAFTWSLATDPTSEICSIVGRTMHTDEWQSIADGALGGEPYSSMCEEAM